jgi:hypothetical protein
MERSQRPKERPVKTLTSILAAGAIVALAAQAGFAANVKHVKKSHIAQPLTLKVGYGPYAYLGSTARVSVTAKSPYAFMGNTAPVGP